MLAIISSLRALFTLATLASGLSAAGSIFSFFKTPLGQVIGVAGLCFIFFLAGDIHRARKDHASAVAEQKRYAQQVAAEKAYAQQAAQQQLDTVTKQNDELNRRVTQYETELATRKTAPCALGGSDVNRLRRITH